MFLYGEMSVSSAFRHCSAEYGPSALEIAQCLTSDLMIMDFILPEMDALEVCCQLRTARNTTTIPLIMVAESVDEIDIVMSLEVGTDCFLTKPVAHQELLARIRGLSRRAGSSCTADYHPEFAILRQPRQAVRTKHKMAVVTYLAAARGYWYG